MTPPADIDWVEPAKPIRGLDHLGVQAPCIALYTQLLPGITNVTDLAEKFLESHEAGNERSAVEDEQYGHYFLGAAAGRHRHHALRGIHDLPPRVRMLVDAVPGGQPQSKRPHDN